MCACLCACVWVQQRYAHMGMHVGALVQQEQIRSSVLINTKPSLTQGLEGQCSWLNPDLLPNLRSHQNSIPNGTSS